MSFEEAATVPLGGTNALHFLRQCDLQRGDRVLINGAGGSIGTMAVQLAKNHGVHVTAVDSGPKLDMLRSIGADEVIDYTQEDFTKRGATYQVIFDVVGKASMSGIVESLSEKGVYLLGNTSFSRKLRGRWTFKGSGKKMVDTTAHPTSKDLVFLKELIENGTIRTIIDRVYSLEDIVAAHRYVESGQKIGNVAIAVALGNTE